MSPARSFTDAGRAGLRVATTAMLADDLPGLVVLAAHGDDVVVEVHGTRSIGGPAVERDSLFRIASISKPIGAVAVGTLVADGSLDLEEPVDRLLPELAGPRVLRRPDAALDDTVPADRPITVRDVLSYTTGYGQAMEMFTADPPWPIAVAAAAGRLNTMGPPRPDVPPDPDAWLAELAALPLLDQPGRRWLYHTSGQLLGVLAARAAGEPLPDLLARRVFAPLGMDDTAFHGSPDRLVTAYEGGAVWDEPDGLWSAPPRFPDAAGGLVSTADDLLAFSRMLLDQGRGVITADFWAAMLVDELVPATRAASGSGYLDDDTSWGFGTSVTITGPRAGSFGWAGGLGTSWHVDPIRDLVVVTLTQRLFASPDDAARHGGIVDAAYAALG